VLGFLGVDEYAIDDADDDKDMGPKDDPLAAELGAIKTNEPVTRRRPKPLPQFTQNISRRVNLPGGYTYFQSRTVEFHKIADQCIHLTSSSPSGSQYIRVSISPTKYIECVTYLGSEPVEIYNLRSLVGLPESTLNIIYNYNLSRDPRTNEPKLDILHYIRGRWAHTIFMDKFHKLFATIKESLTNHPDAVQVKEEILDTLQRDGTDKIMSDERERYNRRLAADSSDVRHQVEFQLIKFLHENKAFVPQIYFLPNITEHVRLDM
jgi:hypothetical protein